MKALICSPNQSIDRTFRIAFNFSKPEKVRKSKSLKSYRNPIIIAQEWRKELINGKYSSQADLAREKNISRARVTQVLNLLKLESNIIRKVIELGDPLTSKVITERKFRHVAHLPSEKQKVLFSKLLKEAKKSTSRPCKSL